MVRLFLRRRLWFLITIASLTTCGTKEKEPVLPSVVSERLQVQINRVEPLLAWTCGNLIPASAYNFPCYREGDGVTMLGTWIAGTKDVSRIPGIVNSIGPDGRLWRNPERVDNDDANSASRDQFIGVIESGHKPSIQKVFDYVQRTGRICPGDDRCDATGGVMILARQALGKTPNPAERALDEQTLLIEASTSPASYRSYLVARKLMLHIRQGYLTQAYARAAKKLHSRYPENLYIWTVHTMANGGDFEPIANALTSCLESWQKPGPHWWGNAMEVHCTDKMQGHELVALGKTLLGL